MSNSPVIRVKVVHKATVDQDISLKPELCQCKNPRKSCRRVILGGTPGISKAIDLRKHRADQEEERGLYTWDLARFRHPQHAEYRDLEQIRKKYICLDFPSEIGTIECTPFLYHKADLSKRKTSSYANWGSWRIYEI